MRRTTAAAIAIAVVLAFLIARTALAAPRPDTTCGWDGTVLWAENLPDDWGLTFTQYPHGIGDGGMPSSYRVDWGVVRPDAWFYTRHGSGAPGAPKFGKQLNDYKVVCIA